MEHRRLGNSGLKVADSHAAGCRVTLCSRCDRPMDVVAVLEERSALNRILTQPHAASRMPTHAHACPCMPLHAHASRRAGGRPPRRLDGEVLTGGFPGPPRVPPSLRCAG